MTAQLILAPGDGNHLHFLNHLATIKVAAGSGGALSAVEFMAPEGMGPPRHTHQHEDELFLVLEGDVTFFAGDDEIEATAGSYAFLPHGQPHTFLVTSETARFTAITASRNGGPQFDQLVAALGTATRNPTIPEPAYIDPTHVADTCRRYGIDVVGPPPGMAG